MHRFKFVDLFAGIGGFRIAFEEVGGECVFAAEYDRFAQDTYRAFHKMPPPDFADVIEVDPPGDITKLDPGKVLDHDILVAGFPCQPFSNAGVSKKNSLGRPHGFDDPTQGTLFFNLKEIIKAKLPKAFVLENVKNLKSHDGGRTFKVIEETIDDLGYELFAEVIDAKAWVPQHRERIFLIGFRRPETSPGQKWGIARFEELNHLQPSQPRKKLEDILEPGVPETYTLGDGTWRTLKRHRKNHRDRGQGFGYGMIAAPYDDKETRTLSARYHKDGAEILIYQGEDRNPRRLTPLECLRLMGFPGKFEYLFDRSEGKKNQPVSDTQAYRQFGNSVVVPLVTDLAQVVVDKLESVGGIVPEARLTQTEMAATADL